MNRQQFLEYVRDNFNVSGEFLTLLNNVLSYAEDRGWCEVDTYLYLDYMLDCTIGLKQQEIKSIVL